MEYWHYCLENDLDSVTGQAVERIHAADGVRGITACGQPVAPGSWLWPMFPCEEALTSEGLRSRASMTYGTLVCVVCELAL